jgi:hypothetical protein
MESAADSVFHLFVISELSVGIAADRVKIG